MKKLFRPRRSRRSRRRRIRARVYRWLGKLVLIWVGVTVPVVLALRWINPPTTAFMIAARLGGENVANTWVSWRRIPPQMALAVVAAEDQRFPDHFGFDWVEIRNAVDTKLEGGRLRGASTISQQTARNLFLWSARSFIRKGIEAYFTVLLEALWSKRRILEVYLNVAQFGKGVYGVGAASRAFFHETPGRLSLYQMSLLASVLPDPVDLHADAPDHWLLKRAASVREDMKTLGGVAYIRGI
ncbi:MAG: monofunctional biosynthetic peptidoglycan transglycosylase [Arenicellales bacterium]